MSEKSWLGLRGLTVAAALSVSVALATDYTWKGTQGNDVFNDAGNYRRRSRYTVPLISADTKWASKASAEAIAANLPAGALPERSELVWVGNDLCLKMPPMGGLILTIR